MMNATFTSNLNNSKPPTHTLKAMPYVEMFARFRYTSHKYTFKSFNKTQLSVPFFCFETKCRKNCIQPIAIQTL